MIQNWDHVLNNTHLVLFGARRRVVVSSDVEHCTLGRCLEVVHQRVSRLRVSVARLVSDVVVGVLLRLQLLLSLVLEDASRFRGLGHHYSAGKCAHQVLL